MKKISLLFISLFLFPFVVFARSANSDVLINGNLNSCSAYQDNSVNINNDIYFSHCMIYSCSTGKTSYNDSNQSVKCSNGNNNPYVEIKKNGCDTSKKYCNKSTEIKYCSILMYYDCNRISGGGSFTTTTTSKVTTTKKTIYTPKTTTTTTTLKEVNNKLSSITLSSGSIDFNSDVFEYNIDVDSIVETINVSAIPVDTTAKINISGNDNINDGSKISITVTGSDNSYLTYVINVHKKEKELSSNALLSKLTIEGYSINFNKNINNYTLLIDKDTSSLKIDFDKVDSNSTVSIHNNENLKSGDKVEIVVKAEDGTENKYIIDITVKKDSNFLKILFIIMLILALLAGGYYLYKKIMQSKIGEKYEYE